MSTAIPDINNLDLQSEPVEVDGDVDHDKVFRPSLPDDGDHVAILKLGQDGVRDKADAAKNGGRRYLTVHVAASVLNEQGQPYATCFDQSVTSIPVEIDGKKTSKLHAILAFMGVPSHATNLADLKRDTEIAFAQQRRVTITTQWGAQVVDGKLANGKDDWVTIAKGQKRFPVVKDEDGTERRSPVIVYPKTGEKVYAQARITKYARLPESQAFAAPLISVEEEDNDSPF